MTSFDDLARRRPVLTYFVLTFAVSWSLFLGIGGSDLVAGEDWDSSSTFQLAILAMLTGPTIASMVLTWRLSGREGFREVWARLTSWRVGVNWYAAALLTAPLLSTAVLLGLWLASSAFKPPVLTDERSPVALIAAVGIGFTTLLEELGWTGFAIPRLRQRHSGFATGLIIGIPWGVWHALQVFWVGRSTAEDVPLGLYLVLYLLFGIASLTAYRVLMVWVYDRTRSLLVVTLMHASYAASTLQIDLLLPKLTGSDLLIQGWALTSALWAVVTGVALAKHGLPLRKRLHGPARAIPEG